MRRVKEAVQWLLYVLAVVFLLLLVGVFAVTLGDGV